MLGKKLRYVKVFSIAEAVKAKECSSKISKIWLISCDIRYCVIKIDFSIFEFEHMVFLVILFMSRLAFLICFSLKKCVSRYYKILFIKKFTLAIVLELIATICRSLSSKTSFKHV